MNPELKISLHKEKKLFEDLLDLLNQQYIALTEKDSDFVKISKVAEDIDTLAKEIAILEIERRKKFEVENNLLYIIEKSNDEDIKEVFENILFLGKKIEEQNEVNCTFIKQKLFFTKKMIKMISPIDRYNTYNNNGIIGAK